MGRYIMQCIFVRLVRNCSFLLILHLAIWGGFSVTHSYADAQAAPEAVTLPAHWQFSSVKESVFDSKVFVAETGNRSRPTVLLVHGMGQAGLLDWLKVIPALEKRYHVVAIDLPGFGRSEKPEGKYSPTNYARVITQIKPKYSQGPVQVVGHSMGAAVTLRYASMFPQDVKSIVLVDAAGILERTAFVKHGAASLIDDTQVPLLFEGMKQLAERYADKVMEVLGNAPDPTQALGNYELIWGKLLGNRSNVNAGLALVNENFASAIFTLPHNVNLIWGRGDQVAPLRTGKLLEKQLKKARLNVIDGARHVPMASHSRVFNEILLTVLAEDSSAIPSSSIAKQELICKNETNKTYKGTYSRVTIENCRAVKLQNVATNSLKVKASRLELENVSVLAEGLAASIDNSVVLGTNLELKGSTGLLVSDSRMDLAGVSIEAKGLGVSIDEISELIFSISRMSSSEYKGTIHGHFKLANSVLDHHVD